MKFYFSSAIFLITLRLFSQTGNTVLNDSLVHTIRVELDLPDWFSTLEQDFDNNYSNPEQYPEIYRACKVTFDGVLLDSCGFREKGNASNSFTNFGKKKPFKISFDEFRNQNLDGLKKLNLNNFTNDPSLLHDATAMKLFRDAGLVAPRTAFATLYVNNEYIGLYVLIENVDKTFLKFHFGSAQNDGNLYKTDRGASVFLNWQGATAEEYKGQGLKLTTNETADDWSQLISFIDLINNYRGTDFKQLLESKFDVHNYLKVLAIEKCIRSWDSYWGGGNNFYLYEHPDGKIRWIPWDMNETFQDVKVLNVTSVLTGYLVPTNKFDERPLLKRIFEIPEYKSEYLNVVCSLLNTHFQLNNLGPFLLEKHNLVADSYLTDPYRYNSFESFKYSLTEDNLDEVSVTHSGYVLRINYPGMYPFIQSQREWAVEQINAWDADCSIGDHTIYDLFVYPNPASDFVNVSNAELVFDYAQFTILDFSGRVCHRTSYDVMSGDSFRLNLGGLSSGMYILLKQSADGRLGRAKLIIR